MSSLPDYGRGSERLILGYGLPRHIAALWREVDWQEHGAQAADIHAEALDKKDPTIVLFPSLRRLPEPERQRAFLRAFGDLLYRRMSKGNRRRWEHKFTLPDPGNIDTFQKDLRKGYSTYLKMVESSTDPVQRLISIHLANALIANNVDVGDAAADLNLRTWPSTEDFANGRRYYSLTPLLGAYCPPKFIDDFGEAFAGLVLDRLENVYHTSVRGVFLALILELMDEG